MFNLPEGYQPRQAPTEFADAPGVWTYQPYVYESAFMLAKRCGARRIVDIGCGSGAKLLPFEKDFELVCIDAPIGLQFARKTLSKAQFIEHDLETGLPSLPESMLRNAVVVCSDVVEHIRRPDKLLRDLAQAASCAPYVLLSTPDRDRARGWLDDGPPANPSHVFEWSGPELLRFMKASGFGDLEFYGHTVNTNFHLAKATTLVVSGRETRRPGAAPANFRVAAVLHTFNENDMIAETVEHLVSQGVEVHVFDNWSTDGSFSTLEHLRDQGLVKHLEKFPKAPTSEYCWREQLLKTAEYARTLDVSWVMHHDADELRVSPWAGCSVRDAVWAIDSLGYNAIDFTVIDFRFLSVSEDPARPYRETMNFFQFGRRPGHFSQVKLWKNTQQIELASSGGHSADFSGRRIFPLKFLLRHYPLRTRNQAATKVFRDRLPRVQTEKAQRGWHTQYDHFEGRPEIPGWNRHELIPWHPVQFMNEYLTERLFGVGIRDEEALY